MDSYFTTVEITYRWVCEICGDESVEQFSAPRGDSVPLPYRLPAKGWKVLMAFDGSYTRVVCPKHQITILADGKPYSL